MAAVSVTERGRGDMSNEALASAERFAFVLHDMFAMPFEDIAIIVGKTPAAARHLASRARRRMQGADAMS